MKLLRNNSARDDMHDLWWYLCTKDSILATVPVSIALPIGSEAYPVCDTQITAPTLRSAAASSLLVRIPVASSNAKRLWSVKAVRIPKRCECRIASWAKDERLA